jgi:hypothetical protein
MKMYLTFVLNVLLLVFLPSKIIKAQEIDSIITKGKITIKEKQFTFLKTETEFRYYEKGILDVDDKMVTFAIFQKDTVLLKQVFRERDGDCNSITLELGDYDVTDSSVIFYSYYAWQGGCCGLPSGVRMQEYVLDNFGNLVLKKASIFLERYKERFYTMQKVDQANWVKNTEIGYNATFVKNKLALRLLKKVKTRLDKQIKKETKGWSNGPFGLRYGYRI